MEVKNYGKCNKNYERKKRREHKQIQRKIRGIVHDTMFQKFGFSDLDKALYSDRKPYIEEEIEIDF